METYTVNDARLNLNELLSDAHQGKTVIITAESGWAVKRVPTPTRAKKPRKAGSARGQVRMSDDFDDPPEDYADTMEIREHIELLGDNPLVATVAGTQFKACLVANLAFNDGSLAAAAHYSIPLASAYGALALHYDNEAAIDEAIRQARELGEQLGARTAQFASKKMKEHLKAP